MNNVTMIGRLAQDPELRFVPGSGNAVANFSLAVDRPFSKERTADFFRIVVWGKQAELVAKYSGKGKRLAVNGYLQTRSYQTQSGDKRYVTEIIANNVEIIEWADRNNSSQNEGGHSKSNSGLNDFESVDFDPKDFNTIEDDDDIPF